MQKVLKKQVKNPVCLHRNALWENRICAGRESGKQSEEKETRNNLKKPLKRLGKSEKNRKRGHVIFTFRIGADFHPEALFRMRISRSEKLSGFRRPAADVRMLPVFTAGITDPDHSVSKVLYIPVFFPAALMNFQRPF